ncbi:MAG TPA: hypothetical protein VGY55_04035 [Pirellulales bacterium]|jgi:hypothetical protein|nr:hypothetical protein [Pirellulales bacterium]
MLAIAFLSGCGGAPSDNKAKDENLSHTDSLGGRAEPQSASALLSSADYAAFRPGRSKTEILNELDWRGNFQTATEYNGKSASAISYGVDGGPLSNNGREIWAIFVDDKFEKLVEPPPGNPEWAKTPRIEIGDFGYLKRATESNAVRIADLEKEIAAHPAPSHVDWGLTAVFLAFSPALEAKRAPALKKNRALRDEYNAARLKIGMTEAEVESIFKAKPLRSGEVKAGSFKVYGSAESLDITAYLHYSNVLVLFREGKLVGVDSGDIPGGEDGLRRIREGFIYLLPQQN